MPQMHARLQLRMCASAACNEVQRAGERTERGRRSEEAASTALVRHAARRLRPTRKGAYNDKTDAAAQGEARHDAAKYDVNARREVCSVNVQRGCAAHANSTHTAHTFGAKMRAIAHGRTVT
eukprot:2761108-Pleurochrysis_carterae.AAC.1